MVQIQFKNYGLEGQTIKVSRKAGESDAYPWGYAEQDMKVEKETPYFLLCTVLKHLNPHGFGPSKPYRTTLHKHDIQAGNFIINGGSIK